MSFLGETLFRKIGDLIGLQINDGDRLFRAGFGGAITIVEQRGVAAVWAKRNRFWKTIGALRRARSGVEDRFTCGQMSVRALLAASGYDKKKRAEQKEKNSKSGEHAGPPRNRSLAGSMAIKCDCHWNAEFVPAQVTKAKYYFRRLELSAVLVCRL